MDKRVSYGFGAALAVFAMLTGFAAGAEEVSGRGIVRSGSEITVDGTALQLYGIVAPAPADRCDSAEGEFQCGVVAWAELIRLADGRVLSCDIEGKGTKGALAATCYVGEADVSEALIRSGWAEVAANVDRYRADQEDARRSRRGLWASRVRAPDRRQAP